MPVVVVLPTYDERASIEATIDAVLARPCAPDVLVVDDSSPDGTGAIVQRIAARQPRVRLLTRPGKQGLGRAYTAGFTAVLDRGEHDVVVQMDVDGSHDAADIDRLVAGLDGADLALGSRYVDGGNVAGWSLRRELLSRSGNAYAQLMLGSPIRDLTGGFKAWRADLLRRVDVAATTSDGYAFQVEMTMRALRAGARIVELPIVFHERSAGRSKMSGRIAFEALRRIPTMRWR
ncbi:MAG TPA: polyprenol monophosphomannose synthase [Mycobacteriales bacterium]|nr:polyprenol monophosphomannose synthase [Mycobacteriales bacterium]